MNHCVDCLHWDESEANDRGYSPCRRVKNDDLGPSDELALTEEICCHNPKLLTRGDFGCVLFQLKRVISTPTPCPA